MLVDVFDRVLDREDVTRPVPVDVVDDRGLRRRLAGPTATGHQDQALMTVGEHAHRVGDTQLFEGWNPERQHAEGGGQGPALEIRVAANSNPVTPGEREIDVAPG